MSFILSFFQNAKLTVTQWALVSMAAVVGILVLLLKVKGTELHQAQVALLKNRFDTATAASDRAVFSAKKRAQKARSHYETVRRSYLDSQQH